MSDHPDVTAAQRTAECVAAFLARLQERGVERPVATALAGEYLRHLLVQRVPSADVVKRSDA